VAENTQVTKGQMIVSFDSQKISQRLFDKQAELNTATKELENKKRKEIENEQSFILTVAEKQMAFDKAKRRYDIVDNSRSENERQKAGIDLTIAENDLFLAQKKLQFHYDNTQLNIQLSQNKIDRLTNEIKDLNKNIKQLTVTAPIAGMVLYKKNWDGEKPAVGSTTNFGQPIIEIAVIEQMQLKVQIAEPDSGKIFEGQSVKISLDGTQEIIFQGKITSLGRIFRDKSAQDKKRIIDAIIAFDSPDLNVLKPGMTARIEIITQKKTISKGDKS
jgi:HlyD family secretion protein